MQVRPPNFDKSIRIYPEKILSSPTDDQGKLVDLIEENLDT